MCVTACLPCHYLPHCSPCLPTCWCPPVLRCLPSAVDLLTGACHTCRQWHGLPVDAYLPSVPDTTSACHAATHHTAGHVAVSHAATCSPLPAGSPVTSPSISHYAMLLHVMLLFIVMPSARVLSVMYMILCIKHTHYK